MIDEQHPQERNAIWKLIDGLISSVRSSLFHLPDYEARDVTISIYKCSHRFFRYIRPCFPTILTNLVIVTTNEIQSMVGMLQSRCSYSSMPWETCRLHNYQKYSLAKCRSKRYPHRQSLVVAGGSWLWLNRTKNIENLRMACNFGTIIKE